MAGWLGGDVCVCVLVGGGVRRYEKGGWGNCGWWWCLCVVGTWASCVCAWVVVVMVVGWVGGCVAVCVVAVVGGCVGVGVVVVMVCERGWVCECVGGC